MAPCQPSLGPLQRERVCLAAGASPRPPASPGGSPALSRRADPPGFPAPRSPRPVCRALALGHHCEALLCRGVLRTGPEGSRHHTQPLRVIPEVPVSSRGLWLLFQPEKKVHYNLLLPRIEQGQLYSSVCTLNSPTGTAVSDEQLDGGQAGEVLDALLQLCSRVCLQPVRDTCAGTGASWAVGSCGHDAW